ncbi:SLC13 family permease [Peptoniphilus rhinitidis]|uniref:SLC13 family permease n=1 Tax=Peptoniphilus rhinitidis TaxID=1175452 RepID=UPI00028A3409|nr:SLC13 family permease [Peptoniphilus rhinitidis]
MKGLQQKFYWNKKYILKTLLCLFVIFLFWILPPIDPITSMGTKVIGVFIGTVLMLSIVDTIWPVFFSFLLLTLTGVMSLNDVIKGSIGNWIFAFVVASMVLTNALNESGFTDRLTTKMLTMKISKKSPWSFMFVYFFICYLVGAFMDQVPATAFFLAFTNEIIKKTGYEKDSKFSNTLSLGAIFSVNLGGAATPISHPLAILGIGIFEQTTGMEITLIDYMAYAVPTTFILFLVLFIIIRYFIKPDVSKVSNLDMNKFSEDLKPMELREKSIATIFFATVILWILPGVLQIFLPKDNSVILMFKNLTITFWAFLAVILLAFVRINDTPLIDLKETMNMKIPWATIFFISIGVLLGSAVSAEGVGLNDFVILNLRPIIEKSSITLVVFLFALGTCALTNFSSNVSTITIMTGVAASVSMVSYNISPIALCVTTTMCGSLAYVLPSSFAPIAMLHADENSDSKLIIKIGIIMVILSGLAATFIGYNILAS